MERRMSIQLTEAQYQHLSRAKEVFELDFRRSKRETWGNFLCQLATGYMLGRMVMAATGDLEIPGIRVSIEGLD